MCRTHIDPSTLLLAWEPGPGDLGGEGAGTQSRDSGEKLAQMEAKDSRFCPADLRFLPSPLEAPEGQGAGRPVLSLPRKSVG